MPAATSISMTVPRATAAPKVSSPSAASAAAFTKVELHCCAQPEAANWPHTWQSRNHTVVSFPAGLDVVIKRISKTDPPSTIVNEFEPVRRFSSKVVSKEHARITWRLDLAGVRRPYIIDLDSTHGTTLLRNAGQFNTQSKRWRPDSGMARFKVTSARPFELHEGDCVTLGKRVDSGGDTFWPVVGYVHLRTADDVESRVEDEDVTFVRSKLARGRFSLDPIDVDSLSEDHHDDSGVDLSDQDKPKMQEPSAVVANEPAGQAQQRNDDASDVVLAPATVQADEVKIRAATEAIATPSTPSTHKDANVTQQVDTVSAAPEEVQEQKDDIEDEMEAHANEVHGSEVGDAAAANEDDDDDDVGGQCRCNLCGTRESRAHQSPPLDSAQDDEVVKPADRANAEEQHSQIGDNAELPEAPDYTLDDGETESEAVFTDDAADGRAPYSDNDGGETESEAAFTDDASCCSDDESASNRPLAASSFPFFGSAEDEHDEDCELDGLEQEHGEDSADHEESEDGENYFDYAGPYSDDFDTHDRDGFDGPCVAPGEEAVDEEMFDEELVWEGEEDEDEYDVEIPVDQRTNGYDDDDDEEEIDDDNVDDYDEEDDGDDEEREGETHDNDDDDDDDEEIDVDEEDIYDLFDSRQMSHCVAPWPNSLRAYPSLRSRFVEHGRPSPSLNAPDNAPKTAMSVATTQTDVAVSVEVAVDATSDEVPNKAAAPSPGSRESQTQTEPTPEVVETRTEAASVTETKPRSIASNSRVRQATAELDVVAAVAFAAAAPRSPVNTAVEAETPSVPAVSLAKVDNDSGKTAKEPCSVANVEPAIFSASTGPAEASSSPSQPPTDAVQELPHKRRRTDEGAVPIHVRGPEHTWRHSIKMMAVGAVAGSVGVVFGLVSIARSA